MKWPGLAGSPVSVDSLHTELPLPEQRGQALIEGLIALLVLLSCWVAVAWLARFQDMALQASHASRFAAFSLTRHSDAYPIDAIRRHYFSGSAHQWTDRHGRQLLSANRPEVALQITRDSSLPSGAQPGGDADYALRLRQGWEIEDRGIVRSLVTVAPKAPLQSVQPTNDSLKVGLSQFDRAYPIMSRHTAILTGAGHASGDADTQQRVAGSDLGWANSANNSYSHGERIFSRMHGVDKAWGRTDPQFDWLNPWGGAIPEHHLNDFQEAGHVRSLR